MNDSRRRSAMAAPKAKTAKSGSAKNTANVWTDEERAAMLASARERKTASRRDPAAERAEGEADVLAKIADMPAADRAMGERIHELVTTTAPSLAPKTY